MHLHLTNGDALNFYSSNVVYADLKDFDFAGDFGNLVETDNVVEVFFKFTVCEKMTYHIMPLLNVIWIFTNSFSSHWQNLFLATKWSHII